MSYQFEKWNCILCGGIVSVPVLIDDVRMISLREKALKNLNVGLGGFLIGSRCVSVFSWRHSEDTFYHYLISITNAMWDSIIRWSSLSLYLLLWCMKVKRQKIVMIKTYIITVTNNKRALDLITTNTFLSNSKYYIWRICLSTSYIDELL